jgi:arylsulfate sulfotransferase
MLLLVSATAGWTMSVTLEPSLQDAARIGTEVNLYASVSDISPGPIWYRFRIRPSGAARFRMVRDYSPTRSINWVPTQTEGSYEIEVTARNLITGETDVETSSYNVESLVTGNTPVISKTSNKLVFLYSAPPCELGGFLRVQFTAPDGFRQSTPTMRCTGNTSTNVYLAGMRAETEYRVQQTISSPGGKTSLGPELTLRTDRLDFTSPATRLLQKSPAASSEGFLLQSNVFSQNVATDLVGNIVWYNPSEIRYLTHAEPGGYFVALYDNWSYNDSEQILRVLDLAGNTVAETNAARVSEQLAAQGKSPITSFHHEARMIGDGRILVLAGAERIMTGVQSPEQVDVLGDVILVLDRDLQVEWAWDAFDHLDVRRSALLGETCMFGSGGCPVFRLAPIANDWLHGNSLQLTPDGNILYSARHQDWLIKINYANGSGSGDVIWRLGKDGDFRIISDDPAPWFSHQHDANFERGSNRLMVHDNGNTRYADDKTAHSRGQVLEIDEQARTAKLVFNADLGDFSRALGSSEKLSNGNYTFGLGWNSNAFGQSLEFAPDGSLVTQIEVETQMYRAYRMKDMYSPSVQ